MSWLARALTHLRRYLVDLPAEARGEALLAAGVGVALLVGSSLLVARWVARMPADYFVRPAALGPHHPALAVARLVLRNGGGALLLVLGAVLALPGVPGPGVATMFVGFALLDFPGKRRFELRVIRSPRVHAAVDRLRARHGQPPLQLPDEPAAAPPPPAG